MNDIKILLRSLKLQVDNDGNIVGFIHIEKFIEDVTQLEPNRDGCIKITCEKKRHHDPKYSHYGPIVKFDKAKKSPTQEQENDTGYN